MDSEFEILGMNVRDKRVYEALLEMPTSSVRSIADRTGINRGSVYESLKQLVNIGMVSRVDSNARACYQANDPGLLHELIVERRRVLQDLHARVDGYSAQVRRVFNPPAGQFVAFYDGDDGVAAILRDVLATCRQANVHEYCVISSPRVSQYLYNNFPHYTKERQRLAVSPRIVRQGPPVRPESSDVSVKYISPLRDTGCYTLIYGGKVALITVEQHNVVRGIIIDDPSIVTLHQLLFEALWTC